MRKFADALDELETVFKPESSGNDGPTAEASSKPAKTATDSDSVASPEADLGQLLDDAVHDVEQFMAADESAESD